jgi:hypothetical protein
MWVRLLAATVAALAGAPAWAWGPNGHQTVGAIADALLAGTPAGHKVRTILGGQSLQTAALWADCAKGVTEKAPSHFVVSARFPECAPFESTAGQRAMTAYVKRNLSACHPAATQEACHRQYHYADVAVQRDSYARGEAGTSDHDIVAAIDAAIAVLQGHGSPDPIDIGSKKEALRLLAHFVGDIHQPLHVGAVYLDTTGHEVDPDVSGLIADSETQGGNLIRDGSAKLHGQWDSIPPALTVAQFKDPGATLARAVPVTSGAVKHWAAAWASETVVASHTAFQGLTFGAEAKPGTSRRTWPVSEPTGYGPARTALQSQQLVKAGARLAQLLQAIWP